MITPECLPETHSKRTVAGMVATLVAVSVAWVGDVSVAAEVAAISAAVEAPTSVTRDTSDRSDANDNQVVVLTAVNEFPGIVQFTLHFANTIASFVAFIWILPCKSSALSPLANSTDSVQNVLGKCSFVP